MTMDWLYGPAEVQQSPVQIQLRSLRLEPETIVEIASRLNAEFPYLEVIRIDRQGVIMFQEHTFDLTRLDTAPAWERQNLALHAMVHKDDRNGEGLRVILHDNWPAVVAGQGLNEDHLKQTPAGTPYTDLVRQIAAKLENEGTPRPVWKQFVPPLAWLFWLSIAATWIWFLLTEHPALSLAICGSLALAATWPLASQFIGNLRTKYSPDSHPGNVIREMGRAELKRQRADRHANLKLAAITIPSGALLGAIATLLVGRP